MATMKNEEREAFLAKTRYGYLTTLAWDGTPRTVPVWFEWDGHTVWVFTGQASAKVSRIRRDARVTLLVANDMNEGEAWVAFDGSARIKLEGGFELAERLAERYWDLSDPDRRATVESWRRAASKLCVIELVPNRIRTYVE
jgi:PPOX class probable F420-dependent enzyme